MEGSNALVGADPATFTHMDVRHTRHTAYQIIYHLVWCPKYRRPVLTGDVSDRLVALIGEIVPELGGEIIKLVVRPDHVHLFGHFRPTLAPHQIMARIKGRTWHTLREEFGTAGHVSSETIRKYIEAQKGT
jgi:putative transposase